MSGIVWINMASGFGGGEYQTAQLMQEISQTNSRGGGDFISLVKSRENWLIMFAKSCLKFK